MITEDQLEQLAISWFQDTGWSYAHGPDIAPDGPSPERSSYTEVVLKGRLLAALKRINPQLPQTALADAAHIATTPAHPTLVRNNQQFHRYLIDGVPVEWSETGRGPGSPGLDPGPGRRRDHVRLIDFDRVENNDYLVVNQFTITGPIPALACFASAQHDLSRYLMAN